MLSDRINAFPSSRLMRQGSHGSILVRFSSPMISRDLLHSPLVRVFDTLCAHGLAWSFYANHAQEDYYITYCASKNLARGHGLTFTLGERVHVPHRRIASCLREPSYRQQVGCSDFVDFSGHEYRCFRRACVWLARLGKARLATPAASLLLAILIATDTKIVDFSTNGMVWGPSLPTEPSGCR